MESADFDSIYCKRVILHLKDGAGVADATRIICEQGGILEGFYQLNTIECAEMGYSNKVAHGLVCAKVTGHRFHLSRYRDYVISATTESR